MGNIEGMDSLSAVYSGLRDLDQEAIKEIREDYANILPELETELSEKTVTSELEVLRKRVQRREEYNHKFMNLSPVEIEGLLEDRKKRQRHEAIFDDRGIQRQEREEQDVMLRQLTKSTV